MSEVILDAILDLQSSRALLKKTEENHPERVFLIDALTRRIEEHRLRLIALLDEAKDEYDELMSDHAYERIVAGRKANS